MILDIYNIIGLLGTELYLLSYALLNMEKIKGSSYTYITMNMLAAVFVLISLFEHWNLSSAIIQGCWIVFSIIGLLNIYLKGKKQTRIEADIEIFE